ncbi:hypothetical protein R1flu_018802 [Riccia fluitans]|uniref:Uncharacterized protein n=1 Tax=Riccia fluitans TaxID=41844 RepID=A0ABD1ZKS1_9MARC
MDMGLARPTTITKIDQIPLLTEAEKAKRRRRYTLKISCYSDTPVATTLELTWERAVPEGYVLQLTPSLTFKGFSDTLATTPTYLHGDRTLRDYAYEECNRFSCCGKSSELKREEFIALWRFRGGFFSAGNFQTLSAILERAIDTVLGQWSTEYIARVEPLLVSLASPMSRRRDGMDL